MGPSINAGWWTKRSAASLNYEEPTSDGELDDPSVDVVPSTIVWTGTAWRSMPLRHSRGLSGGSEAVCGIDAKRRLYPSDERATALCRAQRSRVCVCACKTRKWLLFGHMCMFILILMRRVCPPHHAQHLCIARRMQRPFGIEQFLRPRPKELSALE